jgi:hypothetical protein
MPKQQNGERIFETSNELTSAAYGELWLANADQNRSSFRNRRRLKDISIDRNKAALVCGAGPSLDLHLDLIRRCRDRLCVVAADMAFPALTQHGIDPDFVVNMDPRESLRSCFQQMTAGTKANLIAATITHPAVLGAWKGGIYFYNLFDEQTAVLKRIADRFFDITNVQSRYHVGELCISMTSQHFRFRHIGFTGIDLACLQNQYYAAGVPASFALHPSEVIVLLNSDNQPTTTTGRFALYMQAFVDNYRAYYSKVSELYNLSKGIIPLPYRLADFEALLQ